MSDKYFDPRLYTLLLESYYKKNIIVFDKMGDIIISNNKNGDLFYAYEETSFIFENKKNNKTVCEYIEATNVIQTPLLYKSKY